MKKISVMKSNIALKSLILTSVFAFASLFSTACKSLPEQPEQQSSVEKTFTDSLGRTVNVTSFEKTAVLSGSLAEIWALAGGEIFGVTNDAYDGHNLTLGDEIKNYGDVKNPSAEAIIRDGVDFAILSGTISGQTKLEELLTVSGVTVAYLNAENFDEYLSVLKICTEITGRNDLYEQNGEQIKSQIDAAISRSAEKEKPKVLLLRSYSTGIKAKGSDNMTGQMLKDLGCVNIADSDSSLLEELSLEAIVRADPQFVFITTMGSDEQAAVEQYENTLANNPAWKELTAVKNGNVHILPKDLYHYKPNNRWGEAYENLEEILYGKQ